MCVSKSPKMVATTSTTKDPAILRNPYLDGIEAIRASTAGLKSLRIERGSTSTTSPITRPTAPSVSLDAAASTPKTLKDYMSGGGGMLGAIIRMKKDQATGATIKRS